uniref:Charged multivesicular body protein 1b n=1 Tax=Osmerus mordax TaxID=8014 RepID=C1BJL9_OSMMO|nr:Charged multivesicular body protein 1b [Osmerus mordax]
MSNMEKPLFHLQFAAQELQRSSQKCDKEEKAEKTKVKKAVQKGNLEVARIHAENAIRQKNQSVNFLRMSARVDAVAARVQTALTMNKVTKSMAGVVKGMDATLKSMNLEKISGLMDKFEHQFETLDVQTAHMEDTMSSTTTLTTPQNQVDSLMHEMADEAGLDLNMELPQDNQGLWVPVWPLQNRTNYLNASPNSETRCKRGRLSIAAPTQISDGHAF